MSLRILITGSSGLIGTALGAQLRARGHRLLGLDLAGAGVDRGDVRDREQVRRAVADCDGIVHLAAVSRVMWGERDPATCWSTNVDGTQNMVDAALACAQPPWLVFASSREVYGHSPAWPAREDQRLAPGNVYARSKAAGEACVQRAAAAGLHSAVLRFSNVYGSPFDHVDRVVPAFARAAATGGPMCVHGADNAFDFTHLDDTVYGITLVIDALVRGCQVLPPVHFVTGQATSLGELALMARRLGNSHSPIESAPSRTAQPIRFQGCYERAQSLFDWTPQIDLPTGLADLIRHFRAADEALHERPQPCSARQGPNRSTSSITARTPVC